MLSITWQLPTLPHHHAVPSAQTVFTSLFGMGRGVFPVAMTTTQFFYRSFNLLTCSIFSSPIFPTDKQQN